MNKELIGTIEEEGASEEMGFLNDEEKEGSENE